MRTGRLILLAVAFVPIFILRVLAGSGPNWDSPPDAILQPPPYVIHPGNETSTQRVAISAGQPKDRWIRAVQFQSCDPRLIKSAYFYVDKTGQWLGAWTPGGKTIAFPDTVAAYLPSTAKVIIEIHYASVTEDNEDCSSVGLYFTDKKPLRPLSGMGVQTSVEIPGGTALELKKEFTVIADSYAIALQPEMEGTGRSLEITLVEPSGTSQVLYGTKGFNSGPQAPFVFAEPVFIPKGTRIIATASYQNRDPQIAAHDIFKLTMSLYPSAEFHPESYDALAAPRTRRGTPLKKTLSATKTTPLKKTVAQTKKPTSKKSAAKKSSL